LSVAPRSGSSKNPVTASRFGHIDELLALLANVKGSGPQWTASCPVPGHKTEADRNRSLSIKLEHPADHPAGSILLHCFVGHTSEEIVRRLGLTMAHLFLSPNGAGKKPSGKKLVEAYSYVDEGGRELYQNVRYDPKDFLHRRKVNGAWVWNLDGVRPVPYNLPAIMKGGLICFAEGEKDANNLTKLGFSATSSKNWREEFVRDHLTPEVSVALFEDRDDAGKTVADNCAGLLWTKVKPLKRIALPGDYHDVSDWIDAGATAEMVQALIELTPEYAGVTVTVEDPEPEPEQLPEFPRLTGPLHDLIDGITPDIPYCYKALCALTYIGIKIAGRVKLASEPKLQTRFYSLMLSEKPGTGKSAADVETRDALATLLDGDVWIELSVDSGPALVEALAEHPRLILAPDEMADQWEKGRAGPGARNTLLGEFLKLYQGNETARRVVKKNAEPIKISGLYFAMIGGATEARNQHMWVGTAGASGGLQSRICMAHSNVKMPRLKTPNDPAKINSAANALRENTFIDRELYLTRDAQDAILRWHEKEEGFEDPARIVDHAKRFAMILAATNNVPEISGDTMKRGLQFADYQIACAAKFMPQDASGYAQAFENRVLAYYERRKNKPASDRQIRRDICPERFPGGFGEFSRALRNLKSCQKMVQDGTNRVNNPLWIID
jgi:hypothetical protein